MWIAQKPLKLSAKSRSARIVSKSWIMAWNQLESQGIDEIFTANMSNLSTSGCRKCFLQTDLPEMKARKAEGLGCFQAATL